MDSQEIIEAKRWGEEEEEVKNQQGDDQGCRFDVMKASLTCNQSSVGLDVADRCIRT